MLLLIKFLSKIVFLIYVISYFLACRKLFNWDIVFFSCIAEIVYSSCAICL